MKKAKVCVLIVTYNRKEYLLKLLPNILKQTYQVDKVLIFDNFSSDGTKESLEEKLYINGSLDSNDTSIKIIDNTEVIYFRNSVNSGGSGGFHDGIKKVMDLGCDYIWAMDDDVLPELDCLQNLMNEMNDDIMLSLPTRNDEQYSDGAVIKLNLSNPFKYRKTRKNWVPYNQLKDNVTPIVDMVFEGPLMDIRLIEKIGLPEKELFILFDDSDYAYRASKVTKLVYIKSAVLHKQIIPSKDKTQLMGWKDYYSYRNMYWFDRKYGENVWVKKLRPIFNHLDLCCRAIIKRKYSNIKVLNKAYHDGTKGILGKTVQPGEKFR